VVQPPDEFNQYQDRIPAGMPEIVLRPERAQMIWGLTVLVVAPLANFPHPNRDVS
jgi:hypothetical protein